MAAGLGFKTFTTGEVLTAADTNGYLMQGVLVFASAAARDAAITSPQEGQFAYLKDTNVTTYYTGSAWTNLDTTGMTNPMTTTGDMVYSSSGSTPARLGIGTTGQVVTVAGGIPSWATPSSGGAVVQVKSMSYATATSTSSSTFTDSGLTLAITPTSASNKVLVFTTVNSILRGAVTSGVGLQIVRTSTAISIFEKNFLYTDSGGGTFVASSANAYLDSPATTSATTYKVQFRSVNNTNSVTVQNDGCNSTLVLMEVTP